MGIAAQLHDLGFRIVATRGTAAAIKRMGIPVETINKIQDGSPHVVDWIDRGDVDLVINTPTGTAARTDGYEIRRAAVARGIPCITTIAGGMAAARAIAAARVGDAAGGVAAGAARATGCTRDRTLAPLGRRLAEVCEYRRVGAYDIVVCDDPDGPEPDPGQFYMLAAAEGWGGGDDERPFLPRAFSVMRARRRPAASSCSRTSGPARTGSASCAPATACGSRARSGSASRRRATAAARCSSAAASAPRRWRSGRTRRLAGRGCELARRSLRPQGGRLLGFRDGEHAPARRCCTARASRPTTARSATRARSPTCCSPSSGATRTSRSTPAARPGCSRRCARSAPSTSIPAQLALESGMACGYGACFGCVVPTKNGYVRLCVDGPVLDADTPRSTST